MRKLTLTIVFHLLLFLGVNAQNSDAIYLNSLYKEIQDSIVIQKNLKDSLAYIWYGQLIRPFTIGNELPAHYHSYSNYFSLDTLDQVKLVKEWRARNIQDLKAFVIDKKLTIRVDKVNPFYMLDHAIFDQVVPGKVRELEWHTAFSKSSKLILLSADAAVKQNSQQNTKALSEVYKKYENKYTNGYRQRNFASFFVDGYIASRRLKRMDKRNEKENLLTAPSRFAITLIAPPILMVSNNSLNESVVKGSVLGAVQVIGADFYVDKNFEHYVGFSLFHASPVNANEGLWDASYAGVEVHWNNKLNIGIGRSYSKIGFDEGKKVHAVKLFFSYALFDNFLKK